ncbi:MAG: biotin synthase [Candidatus Desulfovibrio kirbyi]|uniref:Biotin synthase n=1 Tax=Candidatus Desulfovibrio kirbyi TaxID=2696086 RepID=A0A6L2R6B2_9BACT|nr:MAG: biotin synthase [Candidatus Desulfovibrio kirbyi]
MERYKSMKKSLRHTFDDLVRNARSGGISAAEAASLLGYAQAHPNALLDICALARLIALQRDKPPKPFTCGIINAKSGRCAENCAFCAQSAHYKTAAPVYPLVDARVLEERANLLAKHNIDYMGIVISGAGPTERDFDAICESIAKIATTAEIKLCASLGIVSAEQAVMLKQAGLTSYHHNLETARSFYPKICSTHSLELREQTVKNAKAAGLRVCCCGIFGLGESWEQRLELSETLRALDVDALPVNFLRPHAGTPLEHAPKLPSREALLIVALLRLMHPWRDVLICGGRTYTLGRWETLLFAAGANGVMVGDYLVCKNNPLEQDLEMLSAIGFRDS